MNLKEIFENKRIKILEEKIKEQKDEITTLTENLLDTETKLNDALISSKRYQLQLDEYIRLDETVTKLKAEIAEKDTKLEQYQSAFNRVKDLEAELNRKNAEIEYYKKYTEELQCLPAYKKLLDNVSEMKIPDVQTLVENIIKLNSDSNIVNKLDNLSDKIEAVYRYHYLGNRMY